jgi:glycine hydroxymethyltransferase
MVPFDSRSPFQTSGLRFGTAAVTTRGLKESDMDNIVLFIDKVLRNTDDKNILQDIKKEVNALMTPLNLFAW